ncbi:MAG: SusC/RagA family TonB-linked outer membrane protein [Chitinophagaceae bacterium]|nr:SusC/RagA family TonB-linked outer membrane protein [Chitinophagaceae bacterium]
MQFALIAQQKLTGIVTGTGGLPLSGATVAVKGKDSAVTTNVGGSFTITVTAGDVLLFSFIGYATRQVKPGNETTLRISLSESTINLDEIVVTGYTSQKIKEITGSVAVVKPKDLTDIPAGQVEQMLQGRVAGLNVITSGMPGSPSNVRLHGIGNFGDVTPLYIIDGVQGDINSLNPYDIELIQVLKDASAYSIYGVRGANSVIIIATKKGKTSRTKVSYDFYMNTTRPLNYGNDLLNPQEQADLTWIALRNSGKPNPSHLLYGNGINPVIPDYFIAGINTGLSANDPLADTSRYNIDFTVGPINQIVASKKTDTDLFHELFKPAFSHSHSLSVSGANKKNKYFLSFGYLDQQGATLYTYLKRFTIMVNTQFSVNDKIRIGENLQLSYRDNPLTCAEFGGPVDNDIFKSVLAYKVLPVYDIKGSWAHFIARNFWENPVAMRTIAKDNITRYWEVAGNAFAEIDLLNHFTARTNSGGNLINYYFNKFNFYGYDSLGTGLPDNSLTESSGYRQSWTWTNTLKFSQNIGDDHHLNVLVGIEVVDNYNREVGDNKIDFYTNDVNYLFLANGGQKTAQVT